MLDSLKQFANSIELAVVGLLGAFVAARWHKDELISPKDWVMYLLTGLLCARFLTAPVVAYYGITDKENVLGTAFLVGAFGGSVIAAGVKAAKNIDLLGVIRSKFGGGAS